MLQLKQWRIGVSCILATFGVTGFSLVVVEDVVVFPPDVVDVVTLVVVVPELLLELSLLLDGINGKREHAERDNAANKEMIIIFGFIMSNLVLIYYKPLNKSGTQ